MVRVVLVLDVSGLVHFGLRDKPLSSSIGVAPTATTAAGPATTSTATAAACDGRELASLGNTRIRLLASRGGHIHVHHALKILEPRAVDQDGIPSSVKRGVLDPIFKVENLHALLEWVHTVLHEGSVAVVLCHMGKAILVEVKILAVALIDLCLEGRNNFVAHGVDLVLPKEVGMDGAVHLPSVLGHSELIHVLPHARGQEKGMENGPNLLHVSEEGRDKRALNFKLVILEVVVGRVGQDRAASDGLVVLRAVLRGFVFIAKGGVPVRFFGDQKVSDHVDKGNSQHTPNGGQEGLHQKP